MTSVLVTGGTESSTRANLLHLQIDLGINPRAVGVRVPQLITDLLEGQAGGEQPRRAGMTKDMRSIMWKRHV